MKLRKAYDSVASFLSHYIGGLHRNIGEHHVFLFAGGLAFSLLLCILPLVLIVFSIIGHLLEKTTVSEEISLFIHNLIPYKVYADYVEQVVLSRANDFTIFKGVAGLVGMAGILFAASGLFSSMRTVLNTVYKINSNQSVYVSKLRDIGLVLIVVVYFLFSTTLLPMLSIFEEVASRAPSLSMFDLATLADFALEVLSVVLILAVFYTLYFLVPQKRMSKRVVFVSALWSALLWKLAERGFDYYITSVATLTRVYGAYSLVIVVALWIYYTSIVFILGAEIGQLYYERRQQRVHRLVSY